MPDTTAALSPIYDAPIDPATERAFLRYSRGAMVFHWITAVLMFAILPIGWAMVAMPRDDPARPVWFTIHKSIGVTIFAVVVLRILWRAIVRPPALAGRLPAWEAWTARVNHVLLYAILLVMPVSGYVGGHAPVFFGLFPLPVVTEDKAVAHAAITVHLLTQWVVYLAIAMHLLGVAWHVAIRRDGTLERMLPRQTGA